MTMGKMQMVLPSVAESGGGYFRGCGQWSSSVVIPSERRLGAFGIGLILCGFALQSFQYWLALLDVKVT